MPPIRIFTPSFADADNTNAQNLTVKEVVARLPPEKFHVTMISMGEPDARIAERRNTVLLPYSKHGNTPRMLVAVLGSPPDVYFFPRYGTLDEWYLRLRRTFRLRSALVTYVVTMVKDRLVSPVEVLSVNESDVLVGNSRFVTQTVEEYFNVSSVETIYDGIDTRAFYPPVDSNRGQRERLSIFYAGSFQGRKRVSLIIRQAARLPEVDFRLAGKGEEEEPCRKLAAELGCRNVAFLGHLNPSALGEEMRAADLFLFPSVLEGHPQVLGQAAACGLPTVAMNIYRPDYVEDGETGFLAGSETEIEEKLDLLVANRELRARMSAAAVKHAEQFSWDRIAGQWAEVLEAAVKRRRG